MVSKSGQNMCIPPLTEIEKITLDNLGGKRQICKYYKVLMLNAKESTLDKLNAWRNDIQEDVDEADWNDACLKAQKQTISTRLKLLQYKWLTRMYITPVKLHHMSVNIPDICIKCVNEKGTLIHCLWKCPKIQDFWKDVVKCLSKISFSAKLCVFGIFPVDFS